MDVQLFIRYLTSTRTHAPFHHEEPNVKFHEIARLVIKESRWELRINMAESLRRKGELKEANIQLEEANQLYSYIEKEHLRCFLDFDNCGIEQSEEHISVQGSGGTCLVGKWLSDRSLKPPKHPLSRQIHELNKTIESKVRDEELEQRLTKAIAIFEEFKRQTQKQLSDLKLTVEELAPALDTVKILRTAFK